MISLNIEDIRLFTKKLFLESAFDEFLVREAVFVTFNTFTIDGRIKKEHFSEEELEEGKIGEYSSWAMLRPFCFSLIKGKKLPGSFQVVLQAKPEQVEAFLIRWKLSASFRPEQVSGLYVHIRYEEGRLTCVTGTSVNFFTLDKSLDYAWDEAVKGVFKENQVAVVVE